MKTGKKSHLIRNIILVLIACGIAGLVLTYVLFQRRPGPTTASASIQFSFDGAADGIAPNGQKFDVKEMLSDSVLSEALVLASMNSRYTPEQIRPHVVIQGKYPEDMARQVMSYESLLNFTASRELNITDYHPTTFQVALYNNFDESISEADLRSLLDGIMNSYKNYFARAYSYNLKNDVDYFEIDGYDYPQQLDILTTQTRLLRNYASELYAKEPSFRMNGIGFNDIVAQLNTLIDSDIARLDADVTMNALTRNTARLLIQYRYEVQDLNNQMDKQKLHLEQLDALISSYEKNEIIYLSTSDSLTKIDGNSSETYDMLVNRRKSVADRITDINSEIAQYQLKMADLLRDTSTATEAQQDTIGKMAAFLANLQGKTSETESEAAEENGAAAAVSQNEAAGETESAAEADLQAQEQAGAEIAQMSEEEINKAAEEAEQMARRELAILESSINTLTEKGDAIKATFTEMLGAYNQQEINDLTVSLFNYDYDTPKILSGTFVKSAIKTAGPVCAVGFILCMIGAILVRRKEEKAGQEA